MYFWGVILHCDRYIGISVLKIFGDSTKKSNSKYKTDIVLFFISDLTQTQKTGINEYPQEKTTFSIFCLNFQTINALAKKSIKGKSLFAWIHEVYSTTGHSNMHIALQSFISVRDFNSNWISHLIGLKGYIILFKNSLIYNVLIDFR